MKTMRKLLITCAVAALVLALGSTARAGTWNVPGDFDTIQEAIDLAVTGDVILVGPGNYDGATVTKAVEIKGEDGAIINGGPELGTSGLYQGFRMQSGGDGATISHLSFETVDFSIYSGGTDDVTVEHCTFTSPIQAITNWNGNGWNISHNVINGLRTKNGGGIGIFIGTRASEESTANSNLITHNKITGEVVVPLDEIDDYNFPKPPYPDAGYSVVGICLMSDRRDGRPAGPITGNRILKNKVAISSNNPRNHFPGGIELSDLGLSNSGSPDLLDNKVGFNDLRGMLDTVIEEPGAAKPTAILLYPDPLDPTNIISRNLGDDPNNRGHGGVHPQLLFEE